MKVKVYPCKLSGTAIVPASKSYAHRALICAALSSGESYVECADMNDDIRATVRAVTALGARVTYSGGVLTINGVSGRVKEDIVIDCGESGSTLRFMIPVALTLCDGYVRFVGGGKLGERPLGEYFSVFDSQGIYYRNNSGKDGLDLTVRGDLIADDFELEGNISSQFISGLLLALIMWVPPILSAHASESAGTMSGTFFTSRVSMRSGETALTMFSMSAMTLSP